MHRPAIRRQVKRLKARTKNAVSSIIPKMSEFETDASYGLVSVVVPTYNVERYVRECLDSILRQTYKKVELIVVDDGSSDRTLAIVGLLANRDRRVQVISQENSGPAIARNFGAAHAKGEFLVFVDADDLLPPTAIQQMVAASKSSGSDVVIGCIERLRGSRRFIPQWAQRVHAIDRLGTSVEKYPRILRNFYTGSKMYRRSFWDAYNLRYRTGTLFEDQPLITSALCLARSIDVLSTPVYTWRLRDDGTSRSQAMYTERHVRDRIEAIDLTRAVVAESSSPKVYDAWLWTLLEAHFPGYLRQSLRLDEETYGRVIEMISRTVSLDEIERVAGVSSFNRVLLYLGLTQSKSVVDEFLLDRGFDIRYLKLAMDGDKVRGRLPANPVSANVPADLFVLSDEQLEFRSTLRSVAWRSDSILQLTGWAYIFGTAMTEGNSTIGVELVSTDGSASISGVVSRVDQPSATVESGLRFNSYDSSGFVAEFDLAPMVDRLDDGVGVIGEFTVQLHVAVDGVHRSGKFVKRSPNSSAQHLRSSSLGPGVFARPAWSAAAGLTIEFSRRPFGVRSVVSDDVATVVEIERYVGTYEPIALEAQDRNSSAKYRAAIAHKGPGNWVAVLDHLRIPAGSWRFKVDCGGGITRYVHASSITASRFDTPGASVEIGATSGNQLLVTNGSHTCRLDQFEATADGDLLISGVISDGAASTVTIWLDSGVAETDHVAARVRDRNFSAVVPLRWQTWGHDVAAIPPGYYWLKAVYGLSGGSQRSVRITFDENLFDVMPVDAVGPTAFTRLYLDSKLRCRVQLLTPLATRDRSGYALQSRMNAYTSCTEPLTDSVYYQCLDGAAASDSQIEVFRWIESHRPDITQYWGVSDYSVSVPSGATPVLINSSAWFKCLSTCKYICVNHELPTFFRSRPGQTVVQTYHGHPFKSMGVPRWRALGVAETEIEKNVERRDSWDLLVSPSPDATRMYKECFPVHAHVIEIGHPRNDRLVTSLGSLRTEVREELGIGEDQIAILYAPTYRDTIGGPWESRIVDFLSPEELQRSLGDQYVVLVRGHASNVRFAKRSGIAITRGAARRVVDVSTYPDINGLMAASDLGIFDYSSIRFDYSVTNKPMLFFVPDIEDYFGNLPPLIDYSETTPGPQITHFEELCDWIQDIDRYWYEYHVDYEQFQARFNPYEDGNAAQRLAEAMLGLRELGEAVSTNP